MIIVFKFQTSKLEKTVKATEGPLHIARDCLQNRQRRIDNDLVQVQGNSQEGLGRCRLTVCVQGDR